MVLSDQQAADMRADDAVAEAHRKFASAVQGGLRSLPISFRIRLNQAVHALYARLIEIYAELENASETAMRDELLLTMNARVTAFIRSSAARQLAVSSAAAERQAMKMIPSFSGAIRRDFDLAVYEQVKKRRTITTASAAGSEPGLVNPPKAVSPSRVDIGILTIRDDEFRAMLDVFPSKAGIFKGKDREYTLRHADACVGEQYTVAVLRQIEQGNGEAQDAARDLIDDLAPKLVLVVGIAGGLPSDDVKLGDVVLSTRIHDFTVEARKFEQEPTYTATGGAISKALAAAIVNLAGRDELGDWTAGLPSPPSVTWTGEGQLYGPQEWQNELRTKLEHHYSKGAASREPVYVAGTIASSDRLVKDPKLVFPWITTARDILAVEMESGGVYRAARERCPMLAIRGISDIIGLKRADTWTKYACASAAAFTRAFLRTRPVPVDSSVGVASDPG
jgi:nucleoside phosphorylase